MIPLHAVATDDPQRLRFAVGSENLPPRGAVRHTPGRLGAWLERGVISELWVHDAAVSIRLTDDYSWREVGEPIRDALAEALLAAADWQVTPPSDSVEAVTEVVTELLSGEIGAYAESHGGAIKLVAVTGQQVTVELSGACRGCPAAESTLTDRLQRELRRRVGDQVTVCARSGSAATSLGRRLLTLFKS